MAPGSDLALIALLLFGAALLQGFLGFGFGIAAMAGLSLTTDVLHASGVVNVTGLVLTAFVGYRERGHVEWPVVARTVPAIAAGVLVGVTALGSIDGDALVRLLGATIVAIAAWNVLSPSLSRRTSARGDVLAGAMAGVLGGAFNTGGPPLIAHLYRRPVPPRTLRATIQVCFLAISTVRLPVATASGLIGPAVWQEAAYTTPAVLLGVAVGGRLARRLDPGHFRQVSWLALAGMGLVLLIGS